MVKSTKQHSMAAKIILNALTKQDRSLIESIKKLRDMPSHNYEVNIWSGIIDRHSKLVADKTEGEVVIKTAKQREDLAEFIIENNKATTQCDGPQYYY